MRLEEDGIGSLILRSSVAKRTEVVSLVPRSPLVGKLWPGDIVMLLDGESTAHMTPDEAQKRLDDAPGVEHSLLVCAEEDEVGDHDPPELVGQVGTATMWWSPRLHRMSQTGQACSQTGGFGCNHAAERRGTLRYQPKS